MALVELQDAFGNRVLVNPDHIAAVHPYGGNTGIWFSVAVSNTGPESDRNVIVVNGSVDSVKKKLGL